jgi:hypothetical protein
MDGCVDLLVAICIWFCSCEDWQTSPWLRSPERRIICLQEKAATLPQESVSDADLCALPSAEFCLQEKAATKVCQ